MFHPLFHISGTTPLPNVFQPSSYLLIFSLLKPSRHTSIFSWYNLPSNPRNSSLLPLWYILCWLPLLLRFLFSSLATMPDLVNLLQSEEEWLGWCLHSVLVWHADVWLSFILERSMGWGIYAHTDPDYFLCCPTSQPSPNTVTKISPFPSSWNIYTKQNN